MQAQHHNGAVAPALDAPPRLRAPHKDEAPGVQAEGSWVQREVDGADCARRQSANQLTMQCEHERLLEGAKVLKQHALSAAFPAMTDEDFTALKDSIEIVGVQNPVTLFDGTVIDGWHRYRAATELCMPCPTQELGDVDPRDFVIAQNKARRHVTASQMAMTMVAVYAWYPRGGQTESIGAMDSTQKPKTAAKPGESALSADSSKSARELAAIAGVGTRSIEQAKSVHTNATPEVQAAVKSGEIGLPKAAAIAKLPKDEQAAALKMPMAKTPPIKTAPKAKPQTAKQLEAEQIAQDAHGDFDPLAELEEARAEIAALTALVAAAEADDLKAEALKWHRMYDGAVRGQSEAMDRASKSVEREKWTKRQLMRCGKAVGIDDETKIAPAIEAHFRMAAAA